MNRAQTLLMQIGGTANLVAGAEGHYWADGSTSARTRTRGRIKAGTYGKSLMAHFDREKFNVKREEQRAVKRD
jgi:hypothetical protein